MSKLSFRARALDAGKPMPVYKAEELPDAQDIAAINRTVPLMPTGMEREEETEHHLQRALSAQQVYGTAEKLVIPIPDIEKIDDRFRRMYTENGTYKQQKQYVHVQPFGMDQDQPDYDMDSEDESWLEKQAEKMELSPLTFENMMDRLEKGSGQTVVTLNEAKALLKEDDDLIIAVYDYWLNKRLRMQHALIPQCRVDKRDGSATNNPYVAFRRRTEKMMTRKSALQNRKNDEASYEKMLKLKRDLNKALILLELLRKREKTKKEMLKLTVEVVEQRYEVQDWEGALLKDALDKRCKASSAAAAAAAYQPNLVSQQFSWENLKDDVAAPFGRKRREYKKRKHKGAIGNTLPQYSTDVITAASGYSSAEESTSPVVGDDACIGAVGDVIMLQPASPSAEATSPTEEDPDGIFAFKRKPGVSYLAPVHDGVGNWPWSGGGLGDSRFRYNLVSLHGEPRCIGFARRRVGRGGRVLFDRAASEWDDRVLGMDLDEREESDPEEPRSASPTPNLADVLGSLRKARVSHFRPHPELSSNTSLQSPSCLTGFSEESFAIHQEALLAQKRAQQARQQEPPCGGGSGSSLQQPTPVSFTMDSATAEFAASALCGSGSSVTSSSATLTPSVTQLQQPVASVAVSSTGASQPVLSPAVTSSSTRSTEATTATLKSNSLPTSPAVLQRGLPLTAGAAGAPPSAVTSLVTTTAPSGAASPAVASKALPVNGGPPLLRLAGLSQLPATKTDADSMVAIDNVVPMEVT